MKTGTTWTYRIQLGEPNVEPTKYEDVVWPMSQGRMITQTRGRFSPAMDRKRDQFTLKLRVKGPAPKQGPLSYPMGAELEVLQDDLGVFFEDRYLNFPNSPSRTIFFAVTENDHYEALLVIPHDPNAPGAPAYGGWGRGPDEAGYSVRPFFFGARPGLEISLTMGKQHVDHLLFEGSSDAPGSQPKQALHFIRRVDRSSSERASPDNTARTGEEDLLSTGFIEEMWFVRGRGLVQLIQRRADLETMRWTLTEFVE